MLAKFVLSVSPVWPRFDKISKENKELDIYKT